MRNTETLPPVETAQDKQKMTQKEFDESMESSSLIELKQSFEEANKTIAELVENVSDSMLQRARRGFMLGSLLKGVQDSTREKVRISLDEFTKQTDKFDEKLKDLKKRTEDEKDEQKKKVLTALIQELENATDSFFGEIAQFAHDNYSETKKDSNENQHPVLTYEKTKDARYAIRLIMDALDFHTDKIKTAIDKVESSI